jgi:hypothetical protein
VTDSDDLDHIAKLCRRLEEVTREGGQIRATIQRIAEHRSHWPERRSLAEALDRADGKVSDFVSPAAQTAADQN